MITVWSGPGWYAANKNEQVYGQTIHRKRYEIDEKPFHEMSRECDADPNLVLHGSPIWCPPYISQGSRVWVEIPGSPAPWRVSSWEKFDEVIEYLHEEILDLVRHNDHRDLLAHIRLLGELCTARCVDARRVSYECCKEGE